MSSSTNSTTIEPNATLYIKNIDWKIKKGLLRRALYTLFTRHGKVIDIITLRKDGLRGQAFVIMDTIQAATNALQQEQGFKFFNKDLIIEYARNKSDIIAKRDGTYIPKEQRLQQQQQQQQKKRKLDDVAATTTTTEDDDNENTENDEVPNEGATTAATTQ